MNFLERQGSTDSCFAPETFRQLQKVKAVYDPEDLCRSNHPIAPLN